MSALNQEAPFKIKDLTPFSDFFTSETQAQITQLWEVFAIDEEEMKKIVPTLNQIFAWIVYQTLKDNFAEMKLESDEIALFLAKLQQASDKPGLQMILILEILQTEFAAFQQQVGQEFNQQLRALSEKIKKELNS